MTRNKLRSRRSCFQHGPWRPRRRWYTHLEKQYALQHKGTREGITLPWNLWPEEQYHPHVSKVAGCSQASLDQEDLFVYLRHKETQSGCQHLMHSTTMLFFPVPSIPSGLSRRKALTRLTHQVTEQPFSLCNEMCAQLGLLPERGGNRRTSPGLPCWLRTAGTLPNNVNLIFRISPRHSQL